MSDILHDIHRMRPVDTRYVAGRWHRDRISPGGHLVEARLFLQTLRGLGTGPRVKFLVVGRARSGTTLLGRLLDAQPDIACTGELLKRDVWAPALLIDRVARKSPYAVWGAKVLSYQMVQVHRMRDPVGFLRGLEGRGFRFIHLVRDTLPHALSLAVAQASRRFHSDRAKGETVHSVRLDPQDFLARVRWADALLRYEMRVFQEIAHRRLSYEDDLLRPERQAVTISGLCDWFGVPFVPVEAPLSKLLPESPADLVENWDEVAATLRDGGFANLVEGPDRTGG